MAIISTEDVLVMAVGKSQALSPAMTKLDIILQQLLLDRVQIPPIAQPFPTFLRNIFVS